MAGVDYHTIKTFYDELSKHPLDILTAYSCEHVYYISVVFSSENEAKYFLVDRASHWNNLNLSCNKIQVNSTVNEMLRFLEKLMPTHTECTVTASTTDIIHPKLIVPGAKQYLLSKTSDLLWTGTHINTHKDLEKYKKEINVLSDCCDGDEVLISKWIEKKIHPSLPIYRIENTYYLDRANIVIDYPLVTSFRKIFVSSKVNPRIKVCKFSKSKMIELFKSNDLKERITRELQKMEDLQV